MKLNGEEENSLLNECGESGHKVGTLADAVP